MNTIEDVKILHFRECGDERGNLVVIEGNQDVPFSIERTFYIYGSDTTVVRGQHANINTSFVLINVSGTSKVKVYDGSNEKIYCLDKPKMGIYVPTMVWKEMYDFSSDSVLLVLADGHYDASEYIRSKEKYIEMMQCFVDNRL